MDNAKKTVNIGLIGLGTIGGGLVKLIHKKKTQLAKETGVALRLKTVCELSTKRLKELPLGGAVYTKNASDIINDPHIDIVVELIGGLEPAGRFIRESLLNGKDVVSANKALFAERGIPLYKACARTGRHIGMEAAVCGGVPVIKGLKEGLVANDIEYFYGILNGTCNYILTQMSRTGKPYAEALKEAQAKGYAEKDPTLDVNGADTAHKLAILARISFKREIDFNSISCEGIERVTSEDIVFAEHLGYAIKLIAFAKKHKDGRLELRVHPALLKKDHILANVNGVNNAVLINGDEVGETSFYGRGAGEKPTASAVMSDIVDLAAKRHTGVSSPEGIYPEAMLKKNQDSDSRYYLRFYVADKPGMMGALARELGANGVSLSSVRQTEMQGSPVPVVILTHKAREGSVRKAVAGILKKKIVKQKPYVLRLEA